MYQQQTIRTKDASHIAARIYMPAQEARWAIVIAPSADVTQDFYSSIAQFFAARQMAVVTFDFRGTGGSGPGSLKGFDANLENWAQQDLDAVLRQTKQLFPNREVIFIGHGIGGEIIGLAPASQFINRIVLVNCALSCTRLRRWKEKFLVIGMKKMIRATSWMFGYFPGRFLRVLNNLPKGVMDEWVHWCDNENGLFDDFSDHNYRKLQVPLLAFSFDDDWRSQQSGVKALLRHFSSACIQWCHIRPAQLGASKVGHSGYFHERFEQDLWIFTLRWIAGKKTREEELPFTVNNLDDKDCFE